MSPTAQNTDALAEMLDEAQSASGGASEPSGCSLDMSPTEAIAWASEIDLESFSHFTPKQLDEIAYVLNSVAYSTHKNSITAWSVGYVRWRTITKMEKAGLSESADEALSRYPADQEWFKISGYAHSRGVVLSPIGEQVSAALSIERHGRQGFRVLWGAAQTARQKALRQRESELQASQEIAARIAAAKEMLSELPNPERAIRSLEERVSALERVSAFSIVGSRKLILREPTINLSLTDLAHLLGKKLPAAG